FQNKRRHTISKRDWISDVCSSDLAVFSLPRLIPGDAVQLMLDERAYGKDLEDLRAKLGLDQPIYLQYFEWLGRVVRGQLGESLRSDERRVGKCGMTVGVMWCGER